jgi:hypothetical protein
MVLLLADGTKEWWINGKQITKQIRIVCLLQSNADFIKSVDKMSKVL